MGNENPDIVVTFIAHVKMKITALQAVLASLESASALGALGASGEGLGMPSSPSLGGDLGQPIDLPDGAFHGKSVPACIELYLSAAKKKKTNKEITEALQEGGVESNSGKLDNTVTGALFKLKHDGKILRFKDGWGLAEWYPANIRAVSTSSATKSNKKRGKKNGRKNLPSAAKGPEKAKAGDRILEVLGGKPGSEYALGEVAGKIGMGEKGARLALGKLIKAGRVRMTAPATYVIVRPQLVAASS